jgi:hypothetical protein
MSELGIGDENLGDDFDAPDVREKHTGDFFNSSESSKPISEARDNDLLGLPVVVLKNYDAKGAAKREAILNVLANWSTALIENQVHYVVLNTAYRS